MNAELELYTVDLQVETPADLLRILSPEELAFAQTIRNPALKTRHIRVRIVLRQILAAYLKQATMKINIAKTVYGKPYLVDYPDCQFNISHSGDFLLVAVSQIGAVGVDVEQAKTRRRDFSGLVEKCFAESEIMYWNSVAESEKTAEFYRFWTRKEAFVKAVGRGLAIGLQDCVIAAGQKPCFVKLPDSYGQPSDWRLFDLSLTADLYAALVIDSSKISKSFELPNITRFKIK